MGQQVQGLALSALPPKPKDGPSLLQLARYARRREECPVCSIEWSSAIRQLGSSCPAANSEVVQPCRRATLVSGRRTKMHSLLCNWRWFQQNLCSSLCALRFDEHGAPRMRSTSPLAYLPPAMYDVWHYWKQKGGRSD